MFCPTNGFFFKVEIENFQKCSGAAVSSNMLIKHPLKVLWKHFCCLAYQCVHVE